MVGVQFALVLVVAGVWQAYVMPAAEAWTRSCVSPRWGDNHCDCTDGRDEVSTSGCAGAGFFECEAALVEPLRVPTSRVKDGVVDCCDGSDEGQSDVSACATAARRAVEDLHAEAALVARALEARRALAETAVEVSHDAAVAAAELRTALREASPGLDRRRLEYAAAQVRQLEVVAAAPPGLFGSDAGWLGLRGRCFDSIPLSEKRTLGGTSQVEPTEYVFRLCPLENVSQRVRRRTKSRPTLLGVWRAWVDVDSRDGRRLLDVPKHDTALTYGNPGNFSLQLYDGGERCVGDRRRLVLVRPVCALENALSSVDEDGVCTYLVDFATPLACHPAEYDRIARLESMLRSHAAILVWRKAKRRLLLPVWIAVVRLTAACLRRLRAE